MIDVSSKIHHLKVSIPTKMVFESLYQGEETNREFVSPDYEIRNHSDLSVDTYVRDKRMIITRRRSTNE
ncbi:hypothetical protein ACSQ34_06410 [Enterococcus mundtii]|uniref:hypothetical protein n=1 Tax=Enterococcus mundtii TaxID=53346 RepID=UPI000BB59ECA|nr:hypothetical protein [Enterococcus mundtii]